MISQRLWITSCFWWGFWLPALTKEVKLGPCERREKGKKAFPSCRKQNSSVDAKPHTFEFQILARVEQQRPLFLCTCCSSKQSKCCRPGAEGKRLCRRSSTLLYKALPTAPSGCSLAPQASALKEKLNPHIEKNLRFPEPALLRHRSCQQGAWEEQGAFPQAFVEGRYLRPAVCLLESVQGLHAICT